MNNPKTVYHWSPSRNREAILKDGIKILMSEIEYENPVSGEVEYWKPPYICTSLDPLMALTYVLPMFDDDTPPLDLYMIILSENDRVKLRNDETIEILEVRILNSIGPDRVRYLASRP